ncbi:MAG: hypothetical protein ACIAQZ_06265 [Sedimentisphaeraceae bacterium JB056]
MRKIILLTLSVLFLSSCIAKPVSDKINTIALFKNGSGYFLSSVEIDEGVSDFEIMPEVAPANGTFWVSWPKGISVSSLVAEEVDYNEEIEAVTIVELLKANVGSQVKLKVGDDYVTGTLKSFDEKNSSDEYLPYKPGSQSIIPNIKAEMITVETDSGMLVMSASRVSSVSFLDWKMSRSTTRATKKVALKGYLTEESTGAARIDMSYIGQGITWVPSYVVDISKDGKAFLTAKALIINEAADLQDVKILLITGYPNLEFNDTFSPISMKNSLAEFLASLGGSTPSAGRGVMMQNMAKSARFDMVAESAAPINYGDAAQGKQIEDMFFYPLENISLNKKQTGYYPLFSTEVDCKHIYKWDIADNIDRYYRYNNNQTQEDPVVWHCIKLKNSTAQPWTTAPVETVKKNLILGQSTLDFTIPGDEATVKITRAGEVKANQVEYVSKRVANSATFFGTTYDEVTIEGSLFVTNAKKEAVDVEISKVLTGKILNTSPDAQIEKTATNVGQVNETQKLKWNVEVDASDKLELKYSYKAYLRR